MTLIAFKKYVLGWYLCGNCWTFKFRRGYYCGGKLTIYEFWRMYFAIDRR